MLLSIKFILFEIRAPFLLKDGTLTGDYGLSE